jgi:hypothetical chaperone protein
MERVIGLDFGTTNSAIAVADSEGRATLATFNTGSSLTTTFRSILYFPPKDRATSQKIDIKSGPEAIAAYLDSDTKGRLIVSIKSYLASRVFTNTNINGRFYTLEDLIAIMLRRLKSAATEQFGTSASRVVMGRPVHFSGAETERDEARALERLKAAAELAGFTEVSFEFEPVAAAYQYETQLDHDEIVLIGDFGGGTSDFTLARLGPGRQAGENPVIGTSGVAIAGDTFDSRIMMRLVAPKLGLGSHYVSLGKELPVPVWIYSQLSSWHHMFLLKEPKTVGLLREVKSQAREPEKVAALIQIISENLGYALYRAVEETKLQLTGAELAMFRFLPLVDHSYSLLMGGSASDTSPTPSQNPGAVAPGSKAQHSSPSVQIAPDSLVHEAESQSYSAVADGSVAPVSIPDSSTQLERWRFESWIQEDIQRIAQSVQSLLKQSGLTPVDIDSVFLTGGSSFVPYVRRYFSKVFGPAKLRSGEELTTVAKGLALRALDNS